LGLKRGISQEEDSQEDDSQGVEMEMG